MSVFFSHASQQYWITPILLTMGAIFSPPKSPCGLKSNLSDFTYDGLKQVSVFKALKVMWENWPACADHTLCLTCTAPEVHHGVMWLWWWSHKQIVVYFKCAWRLMTVYPIIYLELGCAVHFFIHLCKCFSTFPNSCMQNSNNWPKYF